VWERHSEIGYIYRAKNPSKLSMSKMSQFLNCQYMGKTQFRNALPSFKTFRANILTGMT